MKKLPLCLTWYPYPPCFDYLLHKIDNISKKLSIFNNLTMHRVYFVPKVGYFPTKYFLFNKTSSRRLQDVFQDVFKTSSRRLQDVFARRLAIMSSRRLQGVLEGKKMLHWRGLQDVFKTSSVRLHQDECLLGWYLW